MKILPLNKHDRRTPTFFLRTLMGYAMLVDAVVHILTVGFVQAGLSLECARRLAKCRIEGMKKS